MTESARVHWVVLGSFSKTPTGRSFAMTRDDFAPRLAELAGKLEARVPDRIGGAAERVLTMEISQLSQLTLGGVLKASPDLLKLATFADKIGGSMSVAQALTELEALAGQGKLLEAANALFAPPPAAPQENVSGSIDEVLAETQDEKKLASSAVNAFVSALRPAGAKQAASSGSLKALRALVEDAVYATARDILASPSVAKIEGTWRGLKWVLDQTPKSANINLELVDVTVADAIEKIRSREPLDSLEDPDAFFIVDEIESIEHLQAFAELGEEKLAPVTVCPSAKLWGVASHAEIARGYELGKDDFGAAWDESAKLESSRWIAAVINDVAIFSEGAGAAKRAAWCNPVWAIAAMLSASYHAQGSFGRVIGNNGAVKSPGTHVSDEGAATPTRYFASIRQQADLAKHGLIVLGSPRNADSVMLSEIPTAFIGPEPAALPAQILSGRIVRFSQWVRYQIDATMDDAAVTQLFEQGAEVFLFPGMDKVAQVKATIGAADGKRMLGIYARVHPSHAVTALEISFGLPIR